MVSYRPTIHKSAERELNNLDDADRERMTDLIAEVAREEQPTSHNKVRILEGQPGLFRLRVGEVRAVLELAKPQLRVLSVGYRSNVYECIDSIDERREATA